MGQVYSFPYQNNQTETPANTYVYQPIWQLPPTNFHQIWFAVFMNRLIYQVHHMLDSLREVQWKLPKFTFILPKNLPYHPSWKIQSSLSITVIFQQTTAKPLHSLLKFDELMIWPVSYICSWRCQSDWYCQTSKISHTKSQNLNVSHFVLQLSWPNLLKPGFKSRMKMYLEQCQQVMSALLQLHVSEQQFYCPLRCVLY